MKYLKTLILLFSGIVLLSACSKSPEEKLGSLVPRFQKAMCSKTIECTKDELAQIPAEYRNMIPAFLQSEDACVSYFQENFEKAKKEREEKKEKVTEEMVSAFESCVKGLESSTCEPFKGKRGGKIAIPGCENLDQFSKHD